MDGDSESSNRMTIRRLRVHVRGVRVGVCSSNVVVWDELLVPDEEEGWGQEMLDEPEDPDFFDCAAWAAAAAAGDFPWTEQKQWFSPDKSRAFWSWYLDVAVPESLKHLSP